MGRAFEHARSVHRKLCINSAMAFSKKPTMKSMFPPSSEGGRTDGVCKWKGEGSSIPELPGSPLTQKQAAARDTSPH